MAGDVKRPAFIVPHKTTVTTGTGTNAASMTYYFMTSPTYGAADSATATTCKILKVTDKALLDSNPLVAIKELLRTGIVTRLQVTARNDNASGDPKPTKRVSLLVAKGVTAADVDGKKITFYSPDGTSVIEWTIYKEHNKRTATVL